MSSAHLRLLLLSCIACAFLAFACTWFSTTTTIPAQPGGPSFLIVKPGLDWLLVVGSGLAVIASMLCLATCIGAAVRAALIRRWGWLVAILASVGLASVPFILLAPRPSTRVVTPRPYAR